MANYATLKTAIQQVVKTNGNNEITGALLQQTLLGVVNSLGVGFQFIGVANAETSPGTPDQNVFYIAGPGTYPNFNSASIADGYVGVFKYNGSWTIETLQVGKNYDELEADVNGIKKVLDLAVVQTQTSPDNTVEQLYINATSFQTTGGTSYVIAYKTVTETTKFRVRQVIANPAVSLGVVGYVNSVSDIANGNPVNILGTGGKNTTFDRIVEIPANKVLVISTHINPATSNLTIYEIKYESQRILAIENRLDGIMDSFEKFPIRGKNLIQESAILENTYVQADGNYHSSNGYCAFEIKFPRDKMRIYMNKIFGGYFAIFDKNGNLIIGKSGTVANRIMYSGYMLPDGAAYGRFTWNGTKADLLAYGYISYYHNLVQSEISNRVDYEHSFTYIKPDVVPSEYNGRDMSTFRKILCIGDSLTQGVFNHSSGSGGLDTTGYSYPDILSIIAGRPTVNLGVASITSAGWYEQFANDERLSGCDCAIIQLGVNDVESTLETTSRQAFINIVNRLKELNTGIKIFIAGIINGTYYKSGTSDENYYVKDQFIKSLYNELWVNDVDVYLIDHAKFGHLRDKYPNDYQDRNDNYNMGHLSAYGYNRLAQDYYNYIGWIMHENNVDFRKIQFIGTNYDY